MITVLLIWLAASAFLVAWIALTHFRQPGPFLIPPEYEPNLTLPNHRHRGFIRANDYEFIPWDGRNDLFEDKKIIPPEDYFAMQRMEAADKNRPVVQDYQRFMAALCEDDDTAEYEIIDEDAESIDDLFRDLGGEG